jgi:hypothetical protein
MTDTNNRSRRKFLAQAAGLAAGMAGTRFAGGARQLSAEELGPLNARQRVHAAYELRLQAALFQSQRPLALHDSNGDDERYDDFIGSFSKTLPHDPFGVVDRGAYEALRHALTTGDPVDFASIPMGGTAKLIDPQAAFAFQLDGADSHHLSTRVPPAFASAEQAGEMAELYWLALTRDVAFENYDKDSAIAAAAAALSTLSNFRGPKLFGQITPSTIFRGSTPADLIGPYMSQFLLRNIPYGPYTIPQTIRPGLSNMDYMWDYASWMDIQNGGIAGSFGTVDAGSSRYINDNRALAAYLRADFTAQPFINAAQILSSFGPNALSRSNPYRSSPNQAGFVTFGGAELVDLIAHACGIAMKACWYQKWSVHRRLRPEAFGGAIHNMKTTTRRYAIHHEILDSPVLAAVYARYGTYLLPMAYPEGSPAHPSYPAGHAVYAGAGATVLKAFFDESVVIPSPVTATANGSELVPYSGPPLTVGNELNKLASNISLGRDAAGVHWRSDIIEGMRLGEAAAIALLYDVRRCYGENFSGFKFKRFDGTTATIL